MLFQEGTAFQKIAEGSRSEEFTINIEKNKRRSFLLRESTPVKIHSNHVKVNPKRFETANDTNTEKSDQETRDLLLLTLWKFIHNAEFLKEYLDLLDS